jgi:tetratricopeptide (TPR) repeat protein
VAALQRALDLETTAPPLKRPAGANAGAGEPPAATDDQLAEPSPLGNVLMCLQLQATAQPISAAHFLGHAVRGFARRGRVAPGKPRRTAVLLAVEAAEYLTDAALPGLAKAALALAAKCEAAAEAKAAGIGRGFQGKAAEVAARSAKVKAAKAAAGDTSGEEPPEIRQRRLLVGARLALQDGDAPGALPLAQGAVELDGNDDQSWALLGDVHQLGGRPHDACAAYDRALALFHQRRDVPPLRLFCRLGRLRLQLGRFDAARDLYLQGAAAWQSCSMWLGAGVALLRLEQFLDAERALQEANIRNSQNPAVWGYSCLLCLHAGEARLGQADRARLVATKMDLADVGLLRELGNAYTSLDRLETAEALFRRCLALDDSSAHTRRRLGDVLSAQNAVADAVNEYLKVVDTQKAAIARGDRSGAAECIAAITQCEKLLKTLGRVDEVAPLKAFKRALLC